MSNTMVPSTAGGRHGHGGHGHGRMSTQGGAGGGGGGGGRSNSISTTLSRPSTARSQAGGRPQQVLLCNRCTKPLATTCYLTKCDCIFCEECTFAHFSESSSCPKCARTLGEDDFTELVVADAAGSMTDITKTSLQALFSNQSPSGHLPHAELCRALLRQFDVARQSTKFLLKQLIMDNSLQGQGRAHMQRQRSQYEQQLMQAKQAANNARLRHEQQQRELIQRLRAEEGKVATLQKDMQLRDRQIAQFQDAASARLVAGGGSGGGRGGPPGTANNAAATGGGRPSMGQHMPPSSAMSRPTGQRMSTGHQGPIGGFVAQQEAMKDARHQAIVRRSLPMSSSHGTRGSQQQPMVMQQPPMRHSMGGAIPAPGQHLRPSLQAQPRPYSNGRAPPTPGNRIRDLTNQQYQFTSSDHGQRANKRRRGTGGSAHSSGTSNTFNVSMSPGATTLLNQGPYSHRR